MGTEKQTRDGAQDQRIVRAFTRRDFVLGVGVVAAAALTGCGGGDGDSGGSITEPPLEDVFLETVAENLSFPEGPAYDGRGNVVIVNILGDRRLSRIGADGAVTTFKERVEQGTGPFTYQRGIGATFFRDGSLFLCDLDLKAIVRIPPTGEQEVYADRFNGAPLLGPNDLAFDPLGRLSAATSQGVFGSVP